jgi:hypothetical protein
MFSHRYYGIGIFVAALFIYGLTLVPGVFAWDSAELTLGIYAQGIVHATGYPLYLIFGRLFTLLPLGLPFAVQVNLFSAVMGALTILVLYEICCQLLNGQHLIAACAALFYGFTAKIWTQAVVAEVYTLHTALMAIILLLLLYWLDVPSERLLYSIFFCFGLALANHLATLLVGLVLIPYLLVNTSAWRSRIIAVTIMSFTVILLYLYLPVRTAARPEFDLVTDYFDRDLREPLNIAWMISGRMFGRSMFAYSLLDWVGEIIHFVGELWLNFLGIGLPVGLLGLYRLWKRNPILCFLLGSIFAGQVMFFTSYRVFDKWTMFHTAYLVWAVFIALGVVGLTTYFHARWVKLLVMLIVIVQLLVNWNVAGRSNDYFVQDRTQELLEQLPPDAVLIGPWTTLRPIEYFQMLEQRRPDLQLVDVTLIALSVRDRLAGQDAAIINSAIHAELQTILDCVGSEVFITDPTILLPRYKTVPVPPKLHKILLPEGSQGVDCLQ